MEGLFKLLGLHRPAWLTDGLYYSSIGVVLNINRLSYTIMFMPFMWKWGRCEGDKVGGTAPGLFIGPILIMVQRYDT